VEDVHQAEDDDLEVSGDLGGRAHDVHEVAELLKHDHMVRTLIVVHQREGCRHWTNLEVHALVLLLLLLEHLARHRGHLLHRLLEVHLQT
jgi:hypothetical protein